MVFLRILLHISLFYTSVPVVAPCTIYKPVGDNVIIPIFFKGLTKNAHIKWMRGNDRVYYRKGQEIKETKLKIKPDGSLILDNVQLSDSGTYEATVYDSNGLHVHTSPQQHLCVLAPVSEPAVTYRCVGGWPVLTCTHGGPTDVNVTWHRNNHVTGQTQTLTLNSDLFTAGDRYSCTVRNPVSEKKSSGVQPVCPGAGKLNRPTVVIRCDQTTMQITCLSSIATFFSWNHNGQKLHGKNNKTLILRMAEVKSEDTFSCVVEDGTSVTTSENVKPSCKDQRKLFGMDLWVMVGILAGGGGLVVLLIILSIACCLCKCKKRQEQEKELRLSSLTHPPGHQTDQTPLKKPRRDRGPLPDIPKPRVRPAHLHNSGPGVKNSPYMHMK